MSVEFDSDDEVEPKTCHSFAQTHRPMTAYRYRTPVNSHPQVLLNSAAQVGLHIVDKEKRIT